MKKKVNDGDVYSEKFIYPMDLYTTNQTYTSMWLNNMLSTVISKESFYNNLAVGVTKTSYRKTTDNQIVPDFIEISSTDLNSSDKYKALTYDKYNKMGKLLQYTAIDGRSIVIIWFYNSQYPIAQIVNATYEQVCSALGGETEMERIGCSLVLSDSDKEKLSNLRSDSTLSKAMITSYTYKPLVGMITSTAPNGLTTYYSYDTFNRLKEVYLLDNGIKKILETYDYHYQTR